MMKKNTNVYVRVLFIGFLFFIPQQIEAQFLKKLQKHAEDKIEKEAQRRAERKVDKTIDKGFDEIEDTIDGKNTKKKSGSTANTSENNKNSTSENTSSNQNSNLPSSNKSVEQASKPTVVWSKFDFVPGDQVVFEDGPSVDEENGEFPSRWDLFQGGAEIMEVNGVPAITFITNAGNMHSKGIVPYLKNSKEDYLPEVFTVECDVYFNPSVYNERFYVTLYDRKNQSKNGISQLTVYVNKLRMGTSEGDLMGKERSNRDEVAGWRHISIAYTKGKLKAYLEDQRLINIPHLEGNPTGITIAAGSEGMYVKNVRLAKGGVKYYDRVLSEGKIIVNGIKFDTNKATLKPESMGPINKIYELMQKQPNLNFSVEGHTDSDGDDASNQTLSEARGKAVMDKLIAMGISANRLKSTGFGESKPLDTNSTPEGKANNRRVEFVKFTGNSNHTTSNNSGSSSAFEQLDKKTIGAKLESLPDSFKIPVSNNSGVVNGKGTVIIYATSDGNLGKLEILDVDKYDHNKLTVKYVTYNYNGSVHSESNHLEIKGTYTCDLDKGTIEEVSRNDVDFWYKCADKNSAEINATDSTIFKIYK